jgi:ribosomal protein S18 acetylase RimI-like enzyme
MIRQATLDDAPAIAAIHVRTWQAAYARIVPSDYWAGLSVQEKCAFWQQQLAVNRDVVLVAVNDSKVVGWASGGPSRDVDGEGGAEVYAIYVSPEFWGRGIGRQLMMKIEAAVSPCSIITLWVLGQNQRAIGFYRKMGYEFDGAEKTILLGGVNLTEVRLRKKVLQQPLSTPTSIAPCL